MKWREIFKYYVMKLFCLVGRGSSKQAVILMYHSINPRPHRQSISPAEFEQQLKLLTEQKHLFLTASELLDYKDLPVPANAVCVTFDDGFEDNFVYAVPLLRKYKVKATFFVVTDFIGKPSFLNEFRGMSSQAIQEIAQDFLFEVGSHGCTHRAFSALSATDVASELENSKLVLEEIVNKPIKSFAFPYGDYIVSHLDIVAKIGYQLAVTTKRRRLPKCLIHFFELPRLGVDSFSGSFFVEFFNSGYEWFWRFFDAVYMPFKSLIK